MNRFIYIVLLTSITSTCYTQSIPIFLKSVKDNHPGIKAARELMEVGMADSKTGLSPDNPEINIGYFPGRPDAAGNKRVWEVSQSFDFPTRYARLKRLKATNRELAELEYSNTILDLMSETRQLAIDLITELKIYNKLEARWEEFTRLESAYSKLLINGEVTIIDYNKINIRLTEIKLLLTNAKERIIGLENMLDYMSGNQSFVLKDASYPAFTQLEKEVLLEKRKIEHPAFLIPLKRIEMAEKGIDLSKTGKLPGFEIGYASELVANEEFIGPTIGLTLPLWENKGKVEVARAIKSYEESSATHELMALEMEFKRDYETFGIVNDNLREINSLVSGSVNRDLLMKAFESGELSLTDYLFELITFYDIEDLQLNLEKRYYKLQAALYNHELLRE